MKTVFVLQHEREQDGPNDHGDVKFIGVFSTRRKAERAIIQLAVKPGFIRSPSGFTIDEHLIDKVDWTSGFGPRGHQST
jgi:hypothetical protein